MIFEDYLFLTTYAISSKEDTAYQRLNFTRKRVHSIPNTAYPAYYIRHGVFDIGESNVESMEVCSKFGKFSYNKESVEEVVVGGGEALGVDKDELNIVISVLKDGGGELDDRLDEINLDLSHEFVIMVLESRDVSGGSLVGFLKWVYREKNYEVFSATSR
ncbi:hypothetical protein Tco_0713453 [Tanacetum coccineum]